MVYDEKHDACNYSPASQTRVAEKTSTMIPQALLVDAATSLTAYLYFVSRL